MKKLTFKVSSQKSSSVASLIKEIDKIPCWIYLDFENGSVTVENVNDTIIDTVIELIEKYFTVLSVNIDNTVEEPLAEKQSKVLEPQSEDDLIIKKIEFRNKYVENLINKFLSTAYWALFNKNISEKEIGNFIITSMCEISMRYNNKPCVKFSVGDVVDCSYGMHLVGEINGGHVFAIVCNVMTDGMAYLVPITEDQSESTSQSYLTVNAPEDVIYENDAYKGGTALLDKAKYVRPERINSVIGKATPAFFEKLLHQLASTFDFTNCLANSSKTVDKAVKTPAKKVSNEESALLEVIGFALEKLDASKTLEEQVETFLTDIGMSTSEKMVTQAFIIACNIEKINYENVVLKLHDVYHPEFKEEAIKRILQDNFKEWLNQYPTLAEKCPIISFTSLLKVFAKRFA